MINITICNFKGGVGKSLIAHQLITGFNYHGLELDPYGSLTKQLPDRVKTVKLKNRLLPAIQNKTVFDFGGFDDIKLDQAAAVSNIILIPFIPDTANIKATIATIQAVNKTNKPVLFIASQATSEKSIEDACIIFQQFLKKSVEVFELPFSKAFKTAVGKNTSVIRLSEQKGIKGHPYKKAAGIINNLHKKIIQIINNEVTT